jgi:excisionase family DNA binding protein
MKPVVDVREAAEYLRVSPQTIVRLAKKGHIGRKVGKQWRFPLSGLERYMNGDGASHEQVEVRNS